MPRHPPENIRINPNVRCLQTYPTVGTKKKIESLQTIGIRLSPGPRPGLGRSGRDRLPTKSTLGWDAATHRDFLQRSRGDQQNGRTRSAKNEE